jgi:tungstate transport system substrate-binding protein
MKRHKTIYDGLLSQFSALSVMNRHRAVAMLAPCSLALLATIGLTDIHTRAAAAGVLRLATTTSTADTGLLDAILPTFEKICSCRVDVVAVGTGQALEIGRRSDADVVLVHARAAEDAFVAAHDARERFDVMYNDFVVVGPAADPAKIAGLTRASDAFAAIARAQAPFASRGDQSGTHTKELAVWGALNLTPAGTRWYRSLGQGQGETLVFANEQGAYAISDRGTWLSMRAKVPNLRVLVGGPGPQQNPDSNLRNPYAVMAVNPDTHPGVNFPLATQFIEWLLAPDTQRTIGAYGVERFGQPLFYPNSQQYKAAHGVALSIGESTVPFGGILRT